MPAEGFPVTTATARPPRRPLRKLATLVTVNALVLLALLIPIELLFGTWVRPLRMSDLRRFSIPVGSRYEFDPLLLYTGSPRNPASYSRDQWGLRGSHRSLAEIDVVTIGGSTTEQRYLDDTATWQEIASRELRRLGHPMVIANAGVDGQSTVGHAFTLDYWFPLLPEFRPKFIVFYLGSNDVLRHEQRGSFDGAMDAKNWRFRSATYQLYRTVGSNMRARATGVTHGRMDPLDKDQFTSRGLLPPSRQAEVAADISRRFCDNVEGLRRRVIARGAIPIFMTQTSFGWNSARSAPRGRKATVMVYGLTVNFADVSVFHQELNRALLDYCGRTGTVCFDLANDVAFSAGDYYDYLHNTPQGAEKIGRYLAARLAQQDRAASGERR